MVQSRNGGRGYKIHPDRTGSCVQMVAVPSTALDMGNVKKSITIMGTGELRRHLGPCRGECLVTALHNSFVALHCFVGVSDGLESSPKLCKVCNG